MIKRLSCSLAVCAPSGQRGSVFRGISFKVREDFCCFFRDNSIKARGEAPPRLRRCELGVQDKRAVPAFVPQFSILIVPKPLGTAWISQNSLQKGARGRCLIPKLSWFRLCWFRLLQAGQKKINKNHCQLLQVPRQGHSVPFW